MRFEDLNLDPALLAATRLLGYQTPTPIQAQAIPLVLQGRDVLGCAQTGTGKTAAFALPMLQRLGGPRRPSGPRPVRALVLTPTRELATQIGESFAACGRGQGPQAAVIFGGVGQSPQVRALERGVDILVATPGRLLDLMGQGHARLGQVEILVLDEADRMLDMGFIHDIRKIVAALPRARQTLLFSATLPTEIQRLAGDMLREPVRVSAAPPATTLEAIRQRVHLVPKADKPALLAHLLRAPEVTRALVFTRTKHGADKVVRQLVRVGIPAAAIHGNKSQTHRERALGAFKQGDQRVLVATDIASRGIDVEHISTVFNFDLPHEPEVYVHRIGRTGRAGASGLAVSFCSPEERSDLGAIERLIRQRLEQAPLPTDLAPLSPPGPRPPAGFRPRPRSQGAPGTGSGARPPAAHAARRRRRSR
jgi:ATP-dependent RNA helicase RhlE